MKVTDHRLPRWASMLLCLSILCSVLFSPTTAFADQLLQLQQIFQRISAQQTVRANFVQQKSLASINKVFKSTGRVLFTQNQGVLWQIESPVQADLVMTAHSLLQKTSNTQSRIQLDQSPYGGVATVFLHLMRGDLTTLQQHFTIQSIRREGTGKAPEWSIRLLPKTSVMKKIFSSVDVSGDDFVQQIRLLDKTNATTLIQFHQQRSQPVQLTQHENALFQLAK